MPVAQLDDWPWLGWQRSFPQALALDAGSFLLSWQQLAAQVQLRANGFRQQGVMPGNVVLIRSRNGLEPVLSWLGLLACGACPLVVNPQLPDSLLPSLPGGAGARFALSLNAAACPGAIPLEVRLTAGRWQQPWRADALATLTLTSGSTGSPKAVMHDFNAHLCSAAAVVQLMDFTPRDRWLLSLPMYHVSGLGILWRWLLSGATLVVADDASQYPLALARSSFASLVPTQLWRLMQQARPPGGLRAVLLGGAAIPAALTRQAEAAGIRCFCGYGMTETASTVCAKRADGRDGVGRPLAGQQLKRVNQEIWLRSPTLARGYWQDGALLSLTDADGWLHTGDRGHWQQGEVVIDGRCDNAFFSAGETVQPEQIERILLAHPGVSQAVVVPQADVEYGERPVALVETQLPLAELAAWAAPQLAGFQRPVAWHPLPHQPDRLKPSRPFLIAWLARQQVNGRRAEECNAPDRQGS